MMLRDAIYAAFAREFAIAYRNTNEDLMQRVWDASWSEYEKRNGKAGFKRSTLILALKIACGEA